MNSIKHHSVSDDLSQKPKDPDGKKASESALELNREAIDQDDDPMGQKIRLINDLVLRIDLFNINPYQ